MTVHAGLKTGKCVDADRKPYGKVCEIYSWCPVEIDELPMPGFNLRCVKGEGPLTMYYSGRFSGGKGVVSSPFFYSSSFPYKYV